MTGILRPGQIRIAAELLDGIVSRVMIVSDRPVAIASVMTGQPVETVAKAVAALHGLCGHSHAAAVRFAAAAAMGEAVAEGEQAQWHRRLAGERISEHLRGLFVAGVLKPDPAALRLAQQVARTGEVTGEFSLGMAVRPYLSLSADEDVNGVPARVMTAIRADSLSSDDDPAIVSGLAGDPAFSRFPALPARCPETGPVARLSASAADPVLSAVARLREVSAAIAFLSGRAGTPLGLTHGPVGANTGYAAVETPRGRLIYRLVVTPDGILTNARVVAPTEWNFHPAGPLARVLTGLRPGPDPLADITARAAAFDPCVDFCVEVAHA